MYDAKECGKRLKLLRDSIGKTQQEVADDIGVSLVTISRLECGSRNLSVDMIVQLKEYYGTTSDYIISGEGEREELTLFSSVPEKKRIYARQLIENIKNLFE